MQVIINYWAVVAAAIASMVIGSIWYGPLFGKKFMQEMGMNNMSPEQQTEMKKGMTKTYIIQFIASLVMFYVLAHMMALSENFYGYSPVQTGLTTAFWVWLGFIVPLKLGDAIWGGKMSLFWISIGNMLVTLLAGGAIIGAW